MPGIQRGPWSFEGTYDIWPEGGFAARHGVLDIRHGETGALIRLRLNSAEARQLIQEALMILGMTRTRRGARIRETTWLAAIEEKIRPVLVVRDALFPKPKVRITRSTLQDSDD